MPATNGARGIRAVLGSARVLVEAVDRVVQERLRTEIGRPVTLSQLELLIVIERSAPVSVGRVARLLGVSNPAASKSVDRLVRRGLVRRGESTADRRTVVLELTADGRSLLGDGQRVIQRALDETFAGVAPGGLCEAAERLEWLAEVAIERGPGREAARLRRAIYVGEAPRCAGPPSSPAHATAGDSGRGGGAGRAEVTDRLREAGDRSARPLPSDTT